MKYDISKDFAFISLLTFPVVKELAPAAEAVLGVLARLEHSDKSVSVTDCVINARGGNINALLYEPRGCKEPMPAVVYFHGGGFIYKAAPYHYTLVKKYCVQTPCKVLAVDYRLTPSNPFPAAADDCFDALKWTADNADALGIDAGRIAVAGDSAGGNLAASCALRARDTGYPKLIGQMLVYPVTDRRMKTQSMLKYTDTPVWNAKLSRKMWELYLPSENAENIEYASPAEASDFSALPDTYVETAQFDCLHDEGKAYADALAKAGNSVELYETQGTVHGFDMASHSSIVAASLEKRTAFLQRLFYGDKQDGSAD